MVFKSMRQDEVIGMSADRKYKRHWAGPWGILTFQSCGGMEESQM